MAKSDRSERFLDAVSGVERQGKFPEFFWLHRSEAIQWLTSTGTLSHFYVINTRNLMRPEPGRRRKNR